jgi:hypothetical protein
MDGMDMRVQLPGEEPIATEFTLHLVTGEPYIQHIIIPDHLQKRRIGITICLFVKKFYRKPIYNYWDGDLKQSDAAKAFCRKWGPLLREPEPAPESAQMADDRS